MAGGRMVLVARGRKQTPGRQALRKVRAVERRLNSDPKWITTALDTTPDSTGTVVSIIPIAQGVDESERLGDRVLVNSILIKGIGLQHASAAASTQVRIVLVQALHGNTTAPTAVQVFGSVANMQQGLPRLFGSAEMDQFKVLMDKLILFPAFADNKTIQKINYFKKFKSPLNVSFTGTAGTDEGQNHVFLMVGCNEATNVPTFAWQSVVKFSDI